MKPLIAKVSPITVAVLAALNNPVALADPGDPLSAEFQVNTLSTSGVGRPGIAMDADGDFVIVWESRYQDGSGSGVYARRYLADGSAAAGNEFLVNTETDNAQSDPSIAMDADGDFVIAWESDDQNATTRGVYAQRYAADGTPAGTEFLVGTSGVFQSSPDVAMDADGDFIITYISGASNQPKEVYARRYFADGTPAGSEFQVNTKTGEGPGNPEVAMDADGDFVIIWDIYLGYSYYGYLDKVDARRFSADGVPVGDQFAVGDQIPNITDSASNQTDARVVMDADGNFVIAWISLLELDNDQRPHLFVRRYAADGTPAGDEVRVISKNKYQQTKAGIAMDADGEFIVTWEGISSPKEGIYAHAFNMDADPVGSELRISIQREDGVHEDLERGNPDIAMDADGDFVIAWGMEGPAGSYVDGDRIFAQRFEGGEFVNSSSGGSGAFDWLLALLVLPAWLRSLFHIKR